MPVPVPTRKARTSPVPLPRLSTRLRRISMADYEHLAPQTRSVIERTAEERIRFLRLPVWIGYCRAHAILTRLDALVAHPPMHRMPNLLDRKSVVEGKRG